MNMFKILEIMPTKNIKEIKKAYAKLTRIYHVEDNPKKFEEIHNAYLQALNYAKINSKLESNDFNIESNNYQENKYDKILDRAQIKLLKELEEERIINEVIPNAIEQIDKLNDYYFTIEEKKKYLALYSEIKDNKVFIDMLIDYFQNKIFGNERIKNYFYNLYNFNSNSKTFISKKHEILYNVLVCTMKSKIHQSKLSRYLFYTVLMSFTFIDVKVLFLAGGWKLLIPIIIIESFCLIHGIKSGFHKKIVFVNADTLYIFIFFSVFLIMCFLTMFTGLGTLYWGILFSLITFYLLIICTRNFYLWEKMKMKYFINYKQKEIDIKLMKKLSKYKIITKGE